LFRTFPAKVAGNGKKILPLNKNRANQLFQTPFREKTIHKNLRNDKISYGFSPKYLKKYFPASFLPLFAKFCHFTTSNFFRPGTIFWASFELFGRKFGHLAPVVTNYRKVFHNRKIVKMRKNLVF
jgi:hypothetical protein